MPSVTLFLFLHIYEGTPKFLWCCISNGTALRSIFLHISTEVPVGIASLILPWIMNGKSSDSIKCLKQRFVRILNILVLVIFVILDITCVYCIFVLRTYLYFHDEVENKPSLSKVIIGKTVYFAVSRDQSKFAPSQWETLLHCNDVSHWLGACLNWSLWLWSHVRGFISLPIVLKDICSFLY